MKGGVNMKEIKLTNGFVALVDDIDFKKVSKWKWNVIGNGKNNYARRNYWYKHDKCKCIMMHHLILGKKDGVFIDHINGNGLDNRRENLRHVTVRQNNQNLHVKTTSVYPGVSWHKNIKKWQAQIKINKKSTHLGYYKTENEAFIAYSKAVKNLGEMVLWPRGEVVNES